MPVRWRKQLGVGPPDWLVCIWKLSSWPRALLTLRVGWTQEGSLSPVCLRCQNITRQGKFRLPSMVQWVKNLTTVVPVAAGVRVQSLGWCSGLKDLVLPQLWFRLQLRLRFDPWPRNFHMQRVQPLKKLIIIIKEQDTDNLKLQIIQCFHLDKEVVWAGCWTFKRPCWGKGSSSSRLLVSGKSPLTTGQQESSGEAYSAFRWVRRWRNDSISKSDCICSEKQEAVFYSSNLFMYFLLNISKTSLI